MRSLLKDSGLSNSSILPQASTGRTTRQSQHVNYALLSHSLDVHEPDTAEEALSHPHWCEALVAEMSSLEDNGTREDSLADIGNLEGTLVDPSTLEATLVISSISPTIISSHFSVLLL